MDPEHLYLWWQLFQYQNFLGKTILGVKHFWVPKKVWVEKIWQKQNFRENSSMSEQDKYAVESR